MELRALLNDGPVLYLDLMGSSLSARLCGQLYVTGGGNSLSINHQMSKYTYTRLFSIARLWNNFC
jgi:hypothetical protein